MPIERFFAIIVTITCHAISLALITTPKFSIKKTSLTWLSVIIVTLLFSFLLYPIFPFQIVVASAFLLACILVMSAFFYLSKDSLGKNLFVIISYIDLFFFIFSIPSYLFPTNLLYQFVVRISFYLIFWFLYARFVRVPFNKVTEGLQKGWGQINLMAILFFCFLYYHAIYPRDIASYQLSDFLELLFIGVIIVASNIVVFKTISYMHQVSEMEQVLSKEKYLSSQIELLKESEEHMKRLRHDIRHHNLHVAQYAKNHDIEGLLQYLGQYREEEDRQYIKRFCKNDMVNNILIVYMQKALESDIKIKVDALLDNDVTIKESDFVSILGNILENCIHGCLLYDSPDRFIHVAIYMKANKVVILCKNSSSDDITFINGIPQSKVSKGIGVKSIIHTVSKYDGEYDFSIENHIFTTRILLNVT